MTDRLLSLLRCPVTRGPLTTQVIRSSGDRIIEAILFGGAGWFYPVIAGIPRLLVESFLDHADFLAQHLGDYEARRSALLAANRPLIDKILEHNTRTKESFQLEWAGFDYDHGRTWDEDRNGMFARFLRETAESAASLEGKLVFDAGCGNGLLDETIAQAGAVVVAMDFSPSIGMVSARVVHPDLFFIQGDVRYPPVQEASFDLVQCSGVLVHVAEPLACFIAVASTVQTGGKLSTWLYHPQPGLIHRLMVKSRNLTNRLSLKNQQRLITYGLLPVSWVVKKLKGNRQRKREMMTDLMDHFTPPYRHEFEHEVILEWFTRAGFSGAAITTESAFGFNVTGTKMKRP